MDGQNFLTVKVDLAKMTSVIRDPWKSFLPVAWFVIDHCVIRDRQNLTWIVICDLEILTWFVNMDSFWRSLWQNCFFCLASLGMILLTSYTDHFKTTTRQLYRSPYTCIGSMLAMSLSLQCIALVNTHGRTTCYRFASHHEAFYSVIFGDISQ